MVEKVELEKGVGGRIVQVKRLNYYIIYGLIYVQYLQVLIFVCKWIHICISILLSTVITSGESIRGGASWLKLVKTLTF